jgi:ribosomal protein S18 acetylase RimI-like enzyme
MRTNLAMDLKPDIRVRPATPGDLDALLALENQVFSTDRMSRRSLRRLLAAPGAATLAAECGGRLAGYALLLFRAQASVARLYSIAVRPDIGGRGVASALLAAAEDAAWTRECLALRLEVHADNAPAIALYRKSGFREFGRNPAYYQDGGDALRFEKRIARPPLPERAPPYFHQTTDFTCGPACALMALAWADRSFRGDPIVEFQVWREATTIFMHGGPGGCEPFGLALALARRGLAPEIHVNQPGPYFLHSVGDSDKRRVMRVTQNEFRRQAGEAGLPSRMAALSEHDLMQAFDSGAVAIVLVSGYHMQRRGVPHWVFAYGRDGRHVLVHDPTAKRDPQGRPVAATYAVPWSKFERMMRCGPTDLRAAVVIRKGVRQ